MSFMEKQIYFGLYFEVETTAGTEILPQDYAGCKEKAGEFNNYTEGEVLEPDEIITVKFGWLARMSAPGYLDCTLWGAYKTEQQAIDALDEMYGEDE